VKNLVKITEAHKVRNKESLTS